MMPELSPLKVSGYFGVMFELSGFSGAESLTTRYGLIHARAVGNAAQLARDRKVRALTCSCQLFSCYQGLVLGLLKLIQAY